MKKEIKEFINVVEFGFAFAFGVWLFVIMFLIVGTTIQEWRQEHAIYRSPLDEVWEIREDLKYYFPDKKNGIKEMEGWTMEKWAGEFGWQEYKSLKKYNKGAERDYIYEKYLPLERSLTEISSRVYVRDGKDKYNCIDFSEDLQKILKEEGIESVTITGDTPNGRHRWIAVEFEPISGKFIDDNYEADFLREK